MWVLTNKVKSIKGFVLLSMLIFMQIFLLLNAYALQFALIAMKQSRNDFKKYNTERLAQESIKKAEFNFMHNKLNCFIPVTTPNEISIKSLDWWQSSVSCAGNFPTFQYYYVIEALGIDPCAAIQDDSKIKLANYWRITLLGISDNRKVILQSTVVTVAENQSLVCSANMHMVVLGRQMWRQI